MLVIVLSRDCLISVRDVILIIYYMRDSVLMLLVLQVIRIALMLNKQRLGVCLRESMLVLQVVSIVLIIQTVIYVSLDLRLMELLVLKIRIQINFWI